MTSASVSIGENERLNLCDASVLDRPMTPPSTGNISTVDQINYREKQKVCYNSTMHDIFHNTPKG
jgi:hypothetical protein